MTTATNTTEEGHTPTPENQEDIDGRTPTENILTGQDDDEAAVDSSEAEAALMAGWKKGRDNTTSGGRTRLKEDREGGDETDITDMLLKNGGTEGGDGEGAGEGGEGGEVTDPKATTTPAADDDPEIPGLGRASHVKAQLAEMETLKKTASSLAGRLGHLTQLVSQAGKGKEVTADAFANVANEFGPEFAAALANDLKAAGFGSGATVDPTAIEQMVSAQVEAAREVEHRKYEEKIVLRTHKDARDHFAVPELDDKGKPVLVTVKSDDGQEIQVPKMKAGAKHTAFMQFLKTLPTDRQRELETNGWDSDVVIRALDDFKAHEKKAAKQQATSSARIERAVAPRTGGGGTPVVPPAEDPMERGWKNVKGRQATRAASPKR